MFAKALIPGDPPVPSLQVTTSVGEQLFGQLLREGWSEFGAALSSPAGSQLLVTHRSLQLVVNGQVLLEDLDPAAPAGWWPAVDGLGGRCVVLIVRTGAVDLADPAAGRVLQGLMGQTGAGVWGLVPVSHPASPV